MQVRSSRRSVISALAFAVFMALLVFPAAATTVNEPIILSASLNGDALTIQGDYLGTNKPTVKLGSAALAVTSFSPTKVVATMPTGGLPAGTYRLQYTRANGAMTDFVLTISSAGSQVVLVDGAGNTLGTLFDATFSEGGNFDNGVNDEFFILREGSIWRIMSDIFTPFRLEPPFLGILVYADPNCSGTAYVAYKNTILSGAASARALPQNMVFRVLGDNEAEQYVRVLDNQTWGSVGQCYRRYNNSCQLLSPCPPWPPPPSWFGWYAVERLNFPEDLCAWYPDPADQQRDCPNLILPFKIVVGQ